MRVNSSFSLPFASLAMLGFLALAAPANAQLLGSSVTGSLSFIANGSNNYFDPSFGLVPAGFGNSAPGTSTVTIANPLTEFGFNNTAGITYTANFSSNQLTINSTSTTGTAAFTMTFTDAAFAGLTFTTASDTFGFTGNLVGNTITLTAPQVNNPSTRTAVFNLTGAVSATAPEPGSLTLLLPVMGAVGMVVRKRRHA